NLRRSLVPIALLGMLLFAWVYSHSPVFWTLAVVSILLLNSLISFFWEVWQKPKDVHMLSHLVLSFRFSLQHFAHQLFLLITVPYEAYVYAGAIWRTNWRMIISHRHLLQWDPSHQQIKKGNRNLFQTYVAMWFPVLLAIGVFEWLQYRHADGIGVSLPFL